MDNIIRGVKAIQVLDSRGFPTIQTKVFTNEVSAKAIVPSGLSKGKYEAFELRDHSKAYHGLSVMKAVSNVNNLISKELIKKKYGSHYTLVADEGGFSPPVSDPEVVLDLILKAVDINGYSNKIKLALDCAASEFFTGVNYKMNNKLFSSSELVDYYKNLVKTYPIISIEDPFHQDDFSAFKELTKKLKIQVVGDDLLTTNIRRIKLAVNERLCNALLLKPNQVGTLTESILANRLAKDSRWNVMVSHRSGDTEDTFICDL